MGKFAAVKMARERKCILCETVHASKQEMNEHMRSMLHHRELEKLKGRDCGHECRVCRVSLVSLTDYAGHISSPGHKQNVEKEKKMPAGVDRDEDYFDQALVELVHKRKEQMRKEKEAAAAAKQAQEAEEAKKRAIQQRIKEAKERYQLDRGGQSLPYGFAWNPQHYSWRNIQQQGFRATSPPSNGNKNYMQGKSATWHAQAPPNFQRWVSGDLQGGRCHSQDGALGSHGGSFCTPGRLPWLSNQGSSYGVYGRNNISQSPPNNRPVSYNGTSQMYPPPPQFVASPVNNLQKRVDESAGPQNEAMPTANREPDGKESFGSNPKLDKTCRWSPYPVSKTVDSLPSKDAVSNLAEHHPKEPKGQEKAAEAFISTGKEVKEKSKWSNNGPSNSHAEVPPKPQRIRTPSSGPLPSRQAPKLPETSRKSLARSERRSSLDSSRLAMPRHTEKEPPKGPIMDNKENSCQQNAAKPKPSNPARSSSSCAAKEKLAASSSESIHFLQSLQVSTSTSAAKKTWPAASKHDDPVNAKDALTSPPLKSAEEDHSSEGDPSGWDKTCPKASALSKLDLSPVLKRDLTKRISTKTKTGGHEPNLHSARRVRNLSESRRPDSEKDSGLKPTVQQLINSSGSRRKVNWDQVYQEVRKKQDKGKGKPRFGIEMVPNEDHSQEEDDMAMLENLPWESLMETSTPATSRKRSLSESSLAPASESSLLPSKETPRKSSIAKETGGRPDVEKILNLAVEEAQKQADKLMLEKAKALQRTDCMQGENSSGVEQMEGHGTAKRRRTPGDVLSPEASGVEQDTKRRKTKSKTADRLQIDQLLAVSLREEELSRSLQTVDTKLVQARAALEAAYMEVQRVMVVKQQITTEMSTLREKRIELLKGMQAGNTEVAELPPVRLKQEKTDPAEPELASVAPLCSLSSTSASAWSASPPPSFSSAVTIKQEPLSPVRVSCESERSEKVKCHELIATAEIKPEPLHEAEGDAWSLSGSLESTVKAVQATILPDSKADMKPPSASRRSSETGSLAERRSPSPAFETPRAPNASPGSPSELRGGKRVRRLKKRKVLEKAHGSALPESSDTEMDAEASRPRWLRPQRRASSGSGSTQVSTSTLPRVGDVKMEKDAKHIKQEVAEKMEVAADCQQSLGTTLFSPEAHIPESSRNEQPSLACNEVTSTSDMDICKSSDSDMSFPKISWSPSYTSSGIFEGHQEAVNDMQVHDGLLYTCSGDRTVKAFDLSTRKCVAVFSGHTSKVSCLLVSAAPCLQPRLYSGSSDQTIRCYSLKTQELEQQFNLADRVLCLHNRWKFLYAGLANGTVVSFDLTTNRQQDVFECHAPRAVSCLASSQESSRRILLVGSYDSTISVRDAKTGLLLRTLQGHAKTVLCMKVVNDLVFSGSSDQCVYAHNIHSGELLRVYKGHSHAVTVVTVVGKVMVTACLDKQVRVYDLQSREQLQVYTGHSDMVTSMVVHQSKIYTGCYDGSVQAVKLNLTQKYRCRWHGCSLVFGVMAHLRQHAVADHAANQQTLRCRWKDCEEVFCARNGSKQAKLAHVQKHADEAQPEP
ncbi:zinc finger protein 106 [Phyllopteryx taeniolatus]|uniref:zinc finger protein 106 n=1 Tax=Phyllopteryx taeniolatus TaxID=161469 RepID=UPI002AD2EC34|nr:zinc finger protein 106 [Phyllopteryx taeniolatus]